MFSEITNFQSCAPAMKYGESSKDSLIGGGCSSTTSNSNSIPPTEVLLLKKQLKFFFMNPVEKWHVKRKFPYKFILQVIKIIIITYQLYSFAETRYNHTNYSFNNQVAFSHLFLKNWDVSREIVSYPPVSGPLAIYQIKDLYNNINFVVNNYYNLSIPIGPYSHIKQNNKTLPVILCLEHYHQEDQIIFEDDFEKECLNISLTESQNFTFDQFLKKHNIKLHFIFLARITIHFELKAVTYKYPGKHCSDFKINIIYDNRKQDGQMLLTLKSKLYRIGCTNDIRYTNFNHSETIWEYSLNYFVISICILSMTLCIRAIYKAQLLKYRTIHFFKSEKKIDLSMEGRLSFYNFWYILIITNDILIIIGSYMEGQISRNEYLTEAWSICSLCLGVGNMFVWFGVLRYFEFFKTYNVVTLTLKCAFPKILRFLLCSLIIYAGYVFCGWLVLGPFHIKFRQLSTTSECLFSLINGDDMFATFNILEAESKILWWFSRIYIYSFISLFIYVILSLFLSVIIDAYETIKDYYREGFPKNDLQNFIDEDVGEMDDELLMNLHTNSNNKVWCVIKDFFRALFTCKWKRKRNVENENDGNKDRGSVN